jgi:ATP-dependent DNA helicase RecG
MRPEILFPLFAPVRSLPGVGPSLQTTLERLAGARVIDLLWHLPIGIVDRRRAPDIMTAQPGTTTTLRLRIDEHRPGRSPRQPYRVWCSDATGAVALVFFHARPEYLKRMLPPGAWRLVSGRLEGYGAELQISHPDYIASEGEKSEGIPALEPVYPLAAGVSGKVMRRLIQAALARAPQPAEWLDADLRKAQGWTSWRDALHAVHAPASEADMAPSSPPRRRLAYDELLANQLMLGLSREHARREPGRSTRSAGALQQRLLTALAFRLTRAQEAAIAEITADLAAPQRMLRLLQGDVGSGKTLVAFMAMLQVAEAGRQSAMMAPTELLARQHAQTLARFASAAGVSIGILTGREKAGAREAMLAELASGRTQIAIGTHALFQEGVAFADLALVVIDEQHRFGVHQRLMLAAKGPAADVLVMTATPIPRTLMLAAYGDLDVSQLTEKPPGRSAIDTRTVPLDRLDEVIEAISRALASGAKVYWVCPLVAASEATDAAAAEERVASLRERFGERVGLVHGRMNAGDKDRAMRAFAQGPVAILVATTVIEVGVDVREATIIVIEHAERFGLAQLHQLRGRVGRGSGKSSCILLYAKPLAEPARARLSILRESQDGFRIAEEDLRQRGAGELLGVRQAGLPALRVADLALHADLLPIARDDVQLILERDPDLTSQRGRALRLLLHLFEREAAVAYLRSG